MENTQNKIYFNFSYFALKLLGKGLYNNPWSAISELVANSLDAQATSVYLYINMKDKEHSTIEIFDNGTGMTYKDLAEKYVFMGKNKRDEESNESLRNSYMGRKGIGKLAALYLSKKYYLLTKTADEDESRWRLDSEGPENEIPTLERCNEEINIETSQYWEQFKTGTMIKLTNVDLTGIGEQTIEGLKARLADFFLIDGLKGKIEIAVMDKSNLTIDFQTVKKSIAFKNMFAFGYNTNNDILKNLSSTIVVNSPYSEIRNKKRQVHIFKFDEFKNICGARKFTLKNGILSNEDIKYELKGWIGLHTSIDKETAKRNDDNFLKNKAYKPNQLRLYVRKKLAVENFLDLIKNNQVFANYIEGEISFDILDDDRFDDIATTNRQSLIEDDERVRLLIEILGPIIGKLIRTRIQLSNQVSSEENAILEKEKAKKEAAEKESAKEKTQREFAEKKAEKETEARLEAEKAKEIAETAVLIEKKRSNFLESSLGEDQKVFAKRLHMLKINIIIMKKAIKKMIMLIQRNKFSIDEALANLKKFSYHIARTEATLSYTPYAVFNTNNEKLNGDLFEFITEYINNVMGKTDDINIKVINQHADHFITMFSPQDIVIILDNIVSNSIKTEHKASQLDIIMYMEDNTANIIFKDNGLGLNERIEDINSLFDFGISYTASGTGVGLFHIKEIVEKNLKGTVKINNVSSGFELQIRI